MAKVKGAKTAYAIMPAVLIKLGLDDDQVYSIKKGKVVEVDDVTAKVLVDGGFAIWVATGKPKPLLKPKISKLIKEDEE